MDLPLAVALAAFAGLIVGFAVGRARARAATAVPAPAPAHADAFAAAPDDAGHAPGGFGAGAPADREQPAVALPETGLVLDLAAVGVVRLGPDLMVLAANETATRLLGRRPGTLVGRSAMEAFTDHHVEAALRLALAAGIADGEAAIRGLAPATLLLRARRTDSGGVLVVLQDVSELRRLQRIRAEFIDNLSHELRTPITNVSLLAETLSLEAARLPPKTAEKITRIQVETDHLATMINELLDLSRIEGGGGRLVIDDVDLRHLAATTVGRIAQLAERHGVTIDVVAPPEVPAVRGDGERLGQALLNLVHNAVKFSPPGGPVTVRVMPGESSVVVAVEDVGPGIPRSALPRIFERFYKVDRARTRGEGGTGLGLSIAKHIVEAHGGRIWVDSTEGEGSTFAFSVPFAGPDLAGSPGG